MPAPKKGPRLGGGPAHERLILANLVTALFEHDAITTTEAKAKRMRPLAERMVTFAKRGDLHARRRVMTIIRDKGVVHRLFVEIAPDMAERPGGYTRIVKISPRKGDNAPMAVIELVREPVSAKPKRAVVAEAEGATKRSAKEKKAKDEAAAPVADVQEGPVAEIEDAAGAAADDAAVTAEVQDASVVDEVAAVEAAAEGAAVEAAADEAAPVADLTDAEPVAATTAAGLAGDASASDAAETEAAPAAEATEAATAVELPAGAVAANADASAPEGYSVKGNADSGLYHVAGSQWYDATEAEFWFKSAADAEAAGFKPAGGAAKQQVEEA